MKPFFINGKLLLLAWVFLILCQPMVAAAEDSLSDLDAIVGRWMMLRTTIAEEKRDWDARRGQWKEEIRLLQKESDTLKKEINEGDSFATSVETERATTLARKEQMELELTQLRAVLDSAETDLAKWRARIPEVLVSSVASGFDALPASQEEADKLPITKRAQTVAALYTQLETMQNRIHATQETLDIKGTRRQVDAIYIGLARAFAVSPTNDWVAVGTPGEAGWTWQENGASAAAVRSAISVFNRKQTAQVITLPMQAMQEVTP